MLGSRLQTCLEMVEIGDVVCDVGTDHGYLACELVKNGICRKVIASDINKNPLESAINTIKSYKLENKITPVISDGLKNVNDDDVNCIIIAGMGGETIIDIISNDKKYKKTSSFILQPMTKIEMLREWLYLNGFDIVCEKASFENNKIYIVMKVKYTSFNKKISDLEKYFGKLDYSLDLSKKYAAKQIYKIEKIVNGRKKSENLNYKSYEILLKKMKEAIL